MPVSVASHIDSMTEVYEEKQDSTVVRVYFDAAEDDTFSLQNSISITQDQFDAYARAYSSGLDTSERQIHRTQRNITLPTSLRAISYQADTTDYRSFAYYRGYYPLLQSFVVDDVNAEHEVSCLLLIDSASGYRYYLESTFDNSCEVPLPSPDQQHLLLYATDLYETAGSFFSVLTVNRKERIAYTKLRCLPLPNHMIQAITWMNNTSLAVKVKPIIREEVSDQDTAVQYWQFQL